MYLLPQYTHIVNKKLKHTYLSFDALGNLIIKSPKVSQKYIEQLLLKKSSWINSAREKILQKKGKPVNFNQNPILYYQGIAYPLQLIAHTKKHTKLLFDDEYFSLYFSNYDEKLFYKHIDNFYKQKAKDLIPIIVEQWSQKMNVTPSKINFRKTKRQWGSCSSKNHLSFNTMMMKLPKNVIEYIIVHELSHIRHKHHKKSFWNEVEKYLPQYKKEVMQLHTYTT